MSKCGDCKYWNQEHKLEGYMGCQIWNQYKHAGKKPYLDKGDIQCPQCGHEISLTPDQYDDSQEYEKVNAGTFNKDLENSGLDEVFEGWVGKGMLTNNSIITKAEDSCKYFKGKDK